MGAINAAIPKLNWHDHGHYFKQLYVLISGRLKPSPLVGAL